MSAAALRRLAAAWLQQGRAAIDVEVCSHQGSVPRERGTHMLVSRDAVAGTIGGGHLELQAIAAARRLLADWQRGGQIGLIDPTGPATGPATEPTPVEQHYPLGPALGQCCGGAVTLRSALLTPQRLAAWALAAPRFTLQLYGAGHVGRAIVRLLVDLDCRVQWIDERESEFPPEPEPPHIERVCVDAVEAEVAQAPPGACYLVLTHQHDLDLRITEAILRRGDFAYLGLIGSATKRARFLRRFEAHGIAPEVLARLTCPIGLPGISGKEPEVLAIAVVAQLLGLAYQPSPPPLSPPPSLLPPPSSPQPSPEPKSIERCCSSSE